MEKGCYRRGRGQQRWRVWCGCEYTGTTEMLPVVVVLVPKFWFSSPLEATCAGKMCVCVCVLYTAV